MGDRAKKGVLSPNNGDKGNIVKLKQEAGGFWPEYEELCVEYPEDASWGFIDRESFSGDEGNRPLTAYDFLHGYCDIFSAVIHEKYGYDVYSTYCSNGTLCHSYCRTPDGNYLDIRGRQPDTDVFFEEFEDWISTEEIPEQTFLEEDRDVRRIYSVYKERLPKTLAAAEKLAKMYQEYYCPMAIEKKGE